ncbi:polyubiquitinated misfolded protein transport [Homalodisca vitripennis]|nr:polyubiquitinated misfolded protein transport [Homalodisca vitripennis]
MSKSQKKLEARVARKSPRINQEVAPLESRGKQNQNLQKSKPQRKNEMFIEDVYEKSQSAKDMIRGSTGLVYDTRMVKHRCLWYPAHLECPDRFMKTLDRCEELGLVKRCQPVDVREATETELLTCHTQAHIDRLRETNNNHDVDQMEQLASKFDAIYIHPETFNLALLSAGCTIQLVHEVCSGTVQNGMAIVRPPGHHAMHNEFCGYCYFNNVALAARHALDNLGLRRILIVDWDVHHGQATQQMFYDDPRVVYFSIHRYEHGEFWPNLRESEYDYVGEGQGAGYNFNVPLNAVGMADADYLAIFHQLLLPMASEFQPELVIISAGYDAAVGCPEGEMAVTPACYAHLISSLMALASGKVAVILEGGYCLRSLAEGAALTLRALLGDPCPNLPPLSAPCPSIQTTILNCIYSHRQFWQCFQWQGSYLAADRDPESEGQHWPEVHFRYSGPAHLEVYPTRDTCPVQSQDTVDHINRTLDHLIAETKLFKTKHDVCFVYDALMMEHKNLKDTSHPERPTRILRIFEKHLEFNLHNRLFMLQSRSASREELLLVHKAEYLKEMEELCASTEQMTDDVKHQHYVLEKKNSVYVHPKSYKCASLAAGCLLQVVDSVLQGESKSGVALIRPPGHHAESYEACGFCVFNNVSVAAKYAIKNYGLKRILILDWDVHHGNGTQRIFLSDPQVLYMSIHRYDHGTFFPCSEDAAATVVGSGAGMGFNVNIPWNQETIVFHVTEHDITILIVCGPTFERLDSHLSSSLQQAFISGIYGPSIGFTMQFGSQSKQLVPLSGIFVGIGNFLGGAGQFMWSNRIHKITYCRSWLMLLAFISGCSAYIIVFFNIPDKAVFGNTYDHATIESSKCLAVLCSFLLGLGDSLLNTQNFSILAVLHPDSSSQTTAIYMLSKAMCVSLSFFCSSHLGLHILLPTLMSAALLSALAFCSVDRTAVKLQSERRRASVDLTPKH